MSQGPHTCRVHLPGMERLQRAGVGTLGHSKPAGWDLYFDASEYDAQDRRAQLIAELAAFFASPVGWPLLLGASAWHQRVVVELDWVELSRLCPSSDLREALEHAPTEALACIATAVYEVGCCSIVAGKLSGHSVLLHACTGWSSRSSVASALQGWVTAASLAAS